MNKLDKIIEKRANEIHRVRRIMPREVRLVFIIIVICPLLKFNKNKL